MPVARFRIYPEGRSLYFLVHVWPTKAGMLEYFRRECLADDPDTTAQCSTYSRYRVYPGGQTRISSCMGEINFHSGRMDAEVVVHEVGHAAQGWARRIGLDIRGGNHEPGLVPDGEERYCYGLGRMAAQLNNRLYKLGLY